MDNQNKTVSYELGRSISKLYRLGRWHMDMNLPETIDLASGQHTYLFFLFENDGATQDEISRALTIDKATTARAIQKLEEKGYVRRVSSEKDKRVNHVYLTDSGRACEGALKKNSQKWKALLVEGLNEEELKMMEHIIEKLSENASNYKNAVCRKGGQYDK